MYSRGQEALRTDEMASWSMWRHGQEVMNQPGSITYPWASDEGQKR